MANCIFKGPKGDPGQPGRDGRDGKEGKPGRDGKEGKQGRDGKEGKPGRDGKEGKQGRDGKPGRDGRQGRDGNPGRNGLRGERGPQGKKGEKGEKGDSVDSKPISCGLSLVFNPISCVLTATLRVDKCSISTSVNMFCNIQRIIDEIQITSRAISLQASNNHIQNIGKSQEILNEILKLDFDCDNGLTQVLPTLNLINNNVSANLNLTNQITPKIDIVNTNVIDVKSTVVTVNQNILSVKTDLSLVSQKVINLINSVSQISTTINSLVFSISNLQSTINGINLSISNLNNLVASIQTNLNLVLNVTNTISANINLILDLSTIINNNTNLILICCEEIKNRCFGGGGGGSPGDPLPDLDFIDIICIDCSEVDALIAAGVIIPDEERPPECPADVTDEEKAAGFRQTTIKINNVLAGLQLINSQVSLVQKKVCPPDDADQDCMVLLPDPSLPLTTRGHFLLFSWVLKADPKVSVYQTTSQLRNPIDDLRVILPNKNYWEEYFEPIYKIIGKQYGTYYSKENTREPLVKGWFLNIDEANRFFDQMRTLTKDDPRDNDNPRFSIVTNSTVPIVHTGEEIILRKVCYGYYNEGEFIAVHSWKKPS